MGLRVAVPRAIEAFSPASGAGNMWRHVLDGLMTRADVRLLDPLRPRPSLHRRPDVWLSDCGLGALPVDAPVVVQVHEAGWDDDEIRRLLDPEFVEVVLEGRVGGAVRAASRVITPSESARQQVIGHWGVPTDRVHAVPHGVDSQLFRPDRPGGPTLVAQHGGTRGAPYVLFVSQLHPRKNLTVLRDAMAELVRRGYPHQLVIVGGPAQDRPDSREFEREAEADLPGTSRRVIHLKDVSGEQVADLMSGAAAFCLPSLMEGFGLTALEAMSCGVPVVTSDRGSLPEVVGEAGVVIPPTIEAIRDALGAVLADPQYAARLGRAARARALAYSWDATAEGWLEVLRRAAEDGDRRRRRGR